MSLWTRASDACGRAGTCEHPTFLYLCESGASQSRVEFLIWHYAFCGEGQACLDGQGLLLHTHMLSLTYTQHSKGAGLAMQRLAAQPNATISGFLSHALLIALVPQHVKGML